MFPGHVIPQADVFIPLGKTCPHLYHLPIHFNACLRMFLQIEVPIGVIVLSPIGLDDQILAFIIKICDRDQARLAGFPSDGVKQKDGLCAELRADPSARGADEQGVDRHEDADEEIFHVNLKWPRMFRPDADRRFPHSRREIKP
jgi:hypothetical protein